MGLDQFASTTSQHLESPVDFDAPDDAEELFYWRKHPDLHGWMQNLYEERGGKNPDFNLDPVALTIEDISMLEKDVIGDNLPKTAGFFFGNSNSDADYQAAETLRFCEKARDAFDSGKIVVYYAWW